MASTTTTSNKNGFTTRHHISPIHDFIIVVENYEISKDSKTRRAILRVHEFEVCYAVLREQGSFKLPSFDGKKELKMQEHDPEALKVLLLVLHDFIEEASPEVSILTIWNVLELLRKHHVKPACPDMKDWYAAWYAKHESSINISQCRELLTPSYYFDHAEAFAAVSLMLVMNASRHIEERMPEGVHAGHLKHHLPNNRIVGAINGARGSLRGKLQSRLYDPMTDLLKNANCKYKQMVLWSYLKALEKTEAWPLEGDGNKMSVQELMVLLGEFEYDKYDDPHPDNDPCTDHSNCGINFDSVVTGAINATRKHFNGLCLDCMASSSNEADDREYWNNAKCGYFSRGTCRIKHSRSSWYWSFLGKREKMDHFHEEERRAKERENALAAATFARFRSQAQARQDASA